jgi:hypothetical protein
LWEKELPPFEEKGIKEHLSTCPKCRREFEQFEKTMGWLHSVGEVEVPDEFLPELNKKMEERKRMTPAGKSRKGGLSFPLPLRLPAQAVAMVAVVFLVLYLAKTIPKPPPPFSSEKRPEGVLAQKEVERERGTSKMAPGVPPLKDVNQAETAAKRKDSTEAYAPQMKAEAKKAEEPAPKTEVMAFHLSKPREAARPPSSGPEKLDEELLAEKKSAAATKPSREIVLRISDREKTASQVHELVRQFRGEMITAEGNEFFASLPVGSFSEFERKLAALNASDKVLARKPDMGDLMAGQGVKKQVSEGKGKEPAKLATDEESRIVVRILLVQE